MLVPTAFRERKRIERLNEWRGKVLHGQILKQTEDVSDTEVILGLAAERRSQEKNGVADNSSTISSIEIKLTSKTFRRCAECVGKKPESILSTILSVNVASFHEQNTSAAMITWPE